MVTGKQVQQSMTSAEINSVDHHKCGVCGHHIKYLRFDDSIVLDNNCCHGGVPTEKTWDDAAEWINMQSNNDVKKRLAIKFGIEL